MWTFLLLGLTPFSVAKPTEEDKSKVSIRSRAIRFCDLPVCCHSSGQHDPLPGVLEAMFRQPICSGKVDKTLYWKISLLSFLFENANMQQNANISKLQVMSEGNMIRKAAMNLTWIRCIN